MKKPFLTSVLLLGFIIAIGQTADSTYTVSTDFKHIDKEAIDEFIKGLPVSKEIKMELMAITPENYTGYNY